MPRLHGRRFIEWLEAQNPDAYQRLNETQKRAWREYRTGKQHLTESTADEFCCRTGLHLTFIPDDIYLPETPRSIANLIVRDLKAGYMPNEVADLLELPIGLVRKFA